MPTYVITAPDGQEYEVDAPEGASEQDVLAYAQQNYQQAKRSRPKPKDTPIPNAATGYAPGNLEIGFPGISGTIDTGIPLPKSVELGLAGMGASFKNTAQGLGQIVGAVSQEEVDADRRTDAELMGTTAGMVGNIGGQVAQALVPIGAGARVASYAGRARGFVNPALQGAAFAGAQPVMTGESRGANAAMGGAAGAVGQGLVSGVSAAARGIVRSPQAQQAYRLAQQYGVQLSPLQILNNPTLNTIASAANKLPFTGSRKVAETQRGDFNRAVSRTLGEDAPIVDSTVYGRAKARIGGEFQRLSERNNLNLDDNVLTRLANIEAEAAVSTDASRAVGNVLDDLLRHANNGQVSGRAYKSFDERVGRQLKAAQGESRHYLMMVRDAVRDGMDNSISAADRAAWQAARQQYARLKTVRDLVAKEEGEGIDPLLLRARVTATNAGKEAMASGRGGPLGDLSVIGRRIADRSPDSGTALRSALYNGAGVGVAGAGGVASTSDNPVLQGAGILTLLTMGGARAGNSSRLGRMMVEGSRTMQGVARRVPAPVRRQVGRQVPRMMMLMPGAAAADE